MELLKRGIKDTEAACWHQSYQCSGIRHCELADTQLLTPSERYDRVDLKMFFELREKAALPILPKLDQALKTRTRE
jgi:hypothetical protein